MFHLPTVWCPKPAGKGSTVCQVGPSSERCMCEASDILGPFLFLTRIIFTEEFCFWIMNLALWWWLTPPSAFKESDLFIAIHHLCVLPPAALAGGAPWLVLHQVKEIHTGECAHFTFSTGVCQRLVTQKDGLLYSFLCPSCWHTCIRCALCDFTVASKNCFLLDLHRFCEMGGECAAGKCGAPSCPTWLSVLALPCLWSELTGNCRTPSRWACFWGHFCSEAGLMLLRSPLGPGASLFLSHLWTCSQQLHWRERDMLL